MDIGLQMTDCRVANWIILSSPLAQHHFHNKNWMHFVAMLKDVDDDTDCLNV